MITEEGQQTVLLCKPSCQHAHNIIVQELQAGGLVVDRRLFNISPEQVIAVVLQYPAVKGRVTEHLSAKPSTAASAVGATGAVTAVTEESSDKAADLTDTIEVAQRHRLRRYLAPRQAELPDRRLLSRIQELAQGNRAHPAAAPAAAATANAAGGSTAAFLPAQKRLSSSQHSGSSAEDRRRSARSAAEPLQHLGNNRSGASHNARATTLAYQRSQLSFTAVDTTLAGLALDTVLDHPALEFHLVRQHVEHLIQDGTVLVLLVRGVDAVERLSQLCGPDNVEEARRVAPNSWTARFGRDEVRNAVYAPRTLADAQPVFNVLFGFSPNARTGLAGSGMKQQQQQQHIVSNSTFALSDVAAPPPLTFAALLPALRSQVDAQRRLSYYTGVPNVGTPPMSATSDAAQVSMTSSMGTRQGDVSSTSTSAAHPTAMTRLSWATPYPERRERLDELDDLLQQRTVGC
ncbi:unspecified product [Leptomonas pyrrhocoris]|uniref:Unspecified product n=1 Tax=Leptomonas pyrrhocoris TaxID=157538 RepID=A0A0M9FUD5_LEPPY|nr:unspecified product [Leptomonas pyrrhocoris]KPA76056.1 unspecified product [Leptomonas pyrrhocoris]|eukprot:XP_015654495.1 unspecified product [Leptomonas pyrrhocoris]